MDKAWRNIINWMFIKEMVSKKFDIEFDDELKEKGLKIFESLYTEDEIYELEADNMESELIEIIISYLKEHFPEKKRTKAKSEKKKKAVLVDLNTGLNTMPSMEYINKMIENNPELLDLLQNVEDEDDDDDEDRASQMFI